jgi:hypothetical protein
MVLSFTIDAGPRQHSHSQVRVPRDCLRFQTPPTWRARSPYLYPPGTGWPSYTPRHGVPFSSPPTTRRVTVEVFDPTSTQDCLCMYVVYYARILSWRFRVIRDKFWNTWLFPNYFFCGGVKWFALFQTLRIKWDFINIVTQYDHFLDNG